MIRVQFRWSLNIQRSLILSTYNQRLIIKHIMGIINEVYLQLPEGLDIGQVLELRTRFTKQVISLDSWWVARESLDMGGAWEQTWNWNQINGSGAWEHGLDPQNKNHVWEQSNYLVSGFVMLEEMSTSTLVETLMSVDRLASVNLIGR